MPEPVTSPKGSLNAADLKKTARRAAEWLVASGTAASLLAYVGGIKADGDSLKTIFVGLAVLVLQQLIVRFSAPPLAPVPPASAAPPEVVSFTLNRGPGDTDEFFKRQQAPN